MPDTHKANGKPKDRARTNGRSRAAGSAFDSSIVPWIAGAFVAGCLIGWGSRSAPQFYADHQRQVKAKLRSLLDALPR